MIAESDHSAHEFIRAYKDFTGIDFLKEMVISGDAQTFIKELQGNHEFAEELQKHLFPMNIERAIDHLKYLIETFETPGAEEMLKNETIKYANLMIEKTKQAPRTEKNAKLWETFENTILRNEDVMAHFQGETAKMGVEETIATDLGKAS